MPDTVQIKILRQDSPQGKPYWETFEVVREPGMNMTSVLQRIAANPVSVDQVKTTPVAYDACCLEEVCGACSMVINGQVCQACSSLVDSLLEASPAPIELRPMSKFPVIRDLLVDRSEMFEGLKTVQAWVHVDGYHHVGPGPKIPPRQQEAAYPLSRCMTCGCCLEACPQYNPHSPFIGPAAVSQVILFNSHPTGNLDADQRLAVLTGPGGIADCGNSQNCVKVCPKDIPLTDSIAQAGRDTTLYKLGQWFGR